METLAQYGTAIKDIVAPTFKTYAPLLQANAKAIQSTSHKEYSYGPLDRQKLDVYIGSKARAHAPVLIFIHGGGLVNGDKNLQPIPHLVYANIAHFFAENYGYTVVVLNYRLMMHGATFPSGGEDVSLAVDWIRNNKKELGPSAEGDGPVNLYIMGNSAGGIHAATYLFDSSFTESRKHIVGQSANSNLRLKATVFVGVPFHLNNMDPSRTETIEKYYGTAVADRVPFGLLKTMKQSSPPAEQLPGVKWVVLTGTLDPEDEVLGPARDMVALWRSTPLSPADDIQVEVMQGHNHISPVVALGTGKENEEAWGRTVGSILESLK